MKLQLKVFGAASALALIVAGAAYAADAPAAAPASWESTIKYSGHVELGVTGNPDGPSDGLNYGQLFTDRSNQVLLNSVALTAERDVDTSAKTLDVGFKVQGAYGSDSRYTQLIGEFNRSIKSRNQFDIVEAHIDAHAPWLTAGGMELHAGILPTLEGVEVMDPTGNFFYSKSYLFNFGIPLKYTGIMTETHLSPLVDLYLGIDSGVNTFLGDSGGANADKVHFHGGFGLNYKTVTVLATTQIGPEDYQYKTAADFANFHPSGTSFNRYLNDVVVTWKVNDKLTSTTDINYIYDDGPLKASGGGVTEYLTYPISPTVTIGARGEIWRDDKNFYTAAFPGKFDFINFEGGYGPVGPLAVVLNNGAAATSATFAEFTIGLNYKPAGLPKMIDGLTFRPEIRYDTLLTNGFAYDAGTKSHQTTLAIDVVAPFTL